MALAAQDRRAGLPWPAVWRSWLTARVIVLGASVLAGPVARALHQPRSRHAHGLLGWDAAWYDGIAQHGYSGMPQAAYRFFPLLPATARLLGGHHTGLALLVLSNVAALVLGVLVHELAVDSGLTPPEACQAVWATALLPAGFVLVMGYAEALFSCLVAAFLLALGRRQWRALAVVGVLAGLCRPTGALLVVPGAVVALGVLRTRQPAVLPAVTGALSPLAGLGAWLGWLQLTRGDALLPFHVQTDPHLRGGVLVDVGPQLLAALHGLPHVAGVLVHLAWAAVALALMVRARRRLPLEQLSLAVVTLAVALTANQLGSLERYVGSAVPVLLAAGIATSARAPRWALTGAAVVTLFGYTALAVAGSATP